MTGRTPRGLRLHIGIFGRRNVGKSSLLNAITRQQVSIVSEQAGTTTDPVEKPMELLPLGPVLFIDTAGVDDAGALGTLRVERTRLVLDRTDVGVIVTDCGQWGDYEEALRAQMASLKIPVVVVFNKSDLDCPNPDKVAQLSLAGVRVVEAAATQGVGVLDLRSALVAAAPADFMEAPALLSDLVPPGEVAVLVVPIDKEAPKGRLIMPQVQAIRDLLDNDSWCLVVKERELRSALDTLKRQPRLVVTDSQAFLKVAADTPPDVPMTSFSILFSRLKGDLTTLVRGALAIEKLKAGDRILIAEACSHHTIGEDIGRVKIPRWLEQYVGGKLKFQHVQGHDFPADLSSYSLVIHCGSCTQGRREMLGKILKCQSAGVPISNYGLVIAYSLGIFERALSPFPGALEALRQKELIACSQISNTSSGAVGAACEPRPCNTADTSIGERLTSTMNHGEIINWLREQRPEQLAVLWAQADQVRKQHVGDAVHLRGLVEISNYCIRQCTYCGIRCGNQAVERYRVPASEILQCAHRAVKLGYGTLVMQAGEDPGLTRQWVADLVARIKAETPLAVTLSLGERPDEDLQAWRAAGANRYLLRFETSDPDLYATIHPPRPGQTDNRFSILARLREIGYEVGSGIMVGIPGQTVESVADDLLAFRNIDLDMIGIGPFIAHPDTPLGQEHERAAVTGQVGNDETTVLKVVALARILRPDANIPATTALGTINRDSGRAHGLMRGANVVMPNLTPAQYRVKYTIYPNKASIDVTTDEGNASFRASIESLGRTIGEGAGGRCRAART